MKRTHPLLNSPPSRFSQSSTLSPESNCHIPGDNIFQDARRNTYAYVSTKDTGCVCALLRMSLTRMQINALGAPKHPLLTKPRRSAADAQQEAQPASQSRDASYLPANKVAKPRTAVFSSTGPQCCRPIEDEIPCHLPLAKAHIACNL